MRSWYLYGRERALRNELKVSSEMERRDGGDTRRGWRTKMTNNSPVAVWQCEEGTEAGCYWRCPRLRHCREVR